MPSLTEAQKQAQKQRDDKELEMSLERLHIPNVTFGCKVMQVRGKGQGVRSIMHIPRGGLALAETALFSVDNIRDPLTDHNKSSIWRHADENPQFRDLASKDDQPSDESRFQTNNFEISVTSRNGHTHGIFFKASRFNHSCIPNAYFAWNPELEGGKGQLTIYAIQDIPAYDEILINYRKGDCYMRKDARQAELNNHYGFVCGCPACLRRPGHEFGAGSDARRVRMRTLEASIIRSTNLNTPRARGAKRQNINELIHNLKQEGSIYPQLADALEELGKIAHKELSLARDQRDKSAAAYESYCHDSALQIARDKLDLDVCCTGFRSPVFMKALEFIRSLDR